MDVVEAPEGAEEQALLRELSGLLWRERVALDRLADELLDGGTLDACDGLYHSISALELHRAIAARAVADVLGFDDDASLPELMRAAPPGWADVLASHRRALVDLVNEVTHLARRPVIDLTESPAADLDGGNDPTLEFRPAAVRRQGVQRSLREFIA